MNEDVILLIYEYIHHLNSKAYRQQIDIINNTGKIKKKNDLSIEIRIEIRCIEILEKKKFNGVIEPPIYFFIFKNFFC